MMRKITHIVVHWSASGARTTVKDIRQWHRSAGFKDIGYHRVILHPAAERAERHSWDDLTKELWVTSKKRTSLDYVTPMDLVKAGRPDDQAGAHVYPPRWVNKVSLGVCVIGQPGLPLDSLQKKALWATLDILCKRYDLVTANVKAHRELQPNQCPGDEVYAALQEWRGNDRR